MEKKYPQYNAVLAGVRMVKEEHQPEVLEAFVQDYTHPNVIKSFLNSWFSGVRDAPLIIKDHEPLLGRILTAWLDLPVIATYDAIFRATTVEELIPLITLLMYDDMPRYEEEMVKLSIKREGRRNES